MEIKDPESWRAGCEHMFKHFVEDILHTIGLRLARYLLTYPVIVKLEIVYEIFTEEGFFKTEKRKYEVVIDSDEVY